MHLPDGHAIAEDFGATDDDLKEKPGSLQSTRIVFDSCGPANRTLLSGSSLRRPNRVSQTVTPILRYLPTPHNRRCSVRYHVAILVHFHVWTR